MNPVFETKTVITEKDVDCFGRCKSSELLYIAQEAATRHCLVLKLDWDTMASMGLFWAVTRTHVQILGHAAPGSTVTVDASNGQLVLQI